jgi:stage V sporulation protein G
MKAKGGRVMMEITEVKVRLWDDKRLRALVTIVFEDCFVVRNIKVIEGRDQRLFVAMPSRRQADGSYVDIAHPITREFRREMESTILSTFMEERELSERENEGLDGHDEVWDDEIEAPLEPEKPEKEEQPSRSRWFSKR